MPNYRKEVFESFYIMIAGLQNAQYRMDLQELTDEDVVPHIGNTNFGFIKEMFS